jgi:hypothetical protein
MWWICNSHTTNVKSLGEFFSDNDFFSFKVIDYQDGGCIYPTSKLECKR